MRFIFVAGVLIVSATLACSLAGSQLVAPTPVEATPTVSTPAIEPETKGEPPPVMRNPSCVSPQPGVSLGAFTYETLPEAILDYLNAGGGPEELDSALKTAAFGNQPVAAAVADLNGDGKRDAVASVYNPLSSFMPPPSTLAIYVCRDDRYVLGLSESQDKNAHIWQVMDLDNDGAAEVLLSWATCGAHTCFEEFQVLSWQDGEFVNRLEAAPGELPYPNAQVQDEDGDGIFDVIVSASGIGSVGAGPQRSVTYTWRLEAGATQWTRVSAQPGESPFRIHAVHDGDAAARQGDYELAVELYLRAIHDPGLQEWIEPEAEKANLQAYARYKLMAVLLLQGQDQLAGQIFDELQAEAPAGSAQSVYADLAERYRQAFAQGGGDAACTAAMATVEANPAGVLDPLNAFGYGNPAYTALDMCP